MLNLLKNGKYTKKMVQSNLCKPVSRTLFDPVTFAAYYYDKF